MKNLNLAGINQNDTVIVGLSGGADSVCLAHILKSSDLNLNVVACHINHNLRGEESYRDMHFVEKFCEEYKVKLFIENVDIKLLAKQKSISEEECGRQVRYDFFAKIAEMYESGSSNVHIATAHTLSDTCETVLFNMARGTALKGLCGIPKARANIVRPVINMTREDIENYCEEHGLSFVVDSTNLTCDYTRNKIRHIVVDCLKKINPGFEQNVNRMVKTLSDDNDYLETVAKTAFEDNFKGEELSLEKLSLEHISIKSRCMKLFLEHFGFPVSNKLINSMLDAVELGTGKIEVKTGKYIVVKSNMLSVCESVNHTDFFETQLKNGVYESKTGKIYKIQTLETNQSKIINKIYKNLFDISLDCGKICDSITFRQRISGDKIKLFGHTKSLKKLFNEKHIPLEEREKLFVIADENGVIAVEGLGVDQRAVCDEYTKRYINIRFCSDDE